ncbi:MAG TPA: tRNA preQ1(34) S-adenosylmethionine ribosyltransferase-isomerase QueA [Clostridia bacterium]|nr:tRNA preQ1(34) S-adenosylmethionine ribosyltransferase-isomerase QueA [Clostridia bacterium]
MHISEFDYDLPSELIAQEPLGRRDASRLLVLERQTGKITQRQFADLLSYLKPGDLLVSNKTKVIPARLYGRREKTGALIEVLLLKQIKARHWEVLVRPGKKARPGTRIIFKAGLLEGKVIETTSFGGRIIEFNYEGVFLEILEYLGKPPLPPYIKKEIDSLERYQTVYAREPGSAAAPTAGLHFTLPLLQAIREQGIEWQEILLHVGLDTFRPVKETLIEKHRMHSEYFAISEAAAVKINQALQEKRRIIAVGTTTVRTLESAFQIGEIKAGEGWTNLFIYPGYEFKVISGLITNFHLPKSTLLMMVCAFAGRENVLRAYREAIKNRYRFFSFGDAMLII